VSHFPGLLTTNNLEQQLRKTGSSKRKNKIGKVYSSEYPEIYATSQAETSEDFFVNNHSSK
jgi:hypothetical protein